MLHHPQENKVRARQNRYICFVSAVTILMTSCGYSLELKRIDSKAEDPITVIRRELRQLKADHRVAIFDLQKEQKNRIDAMRVNLSRIGKANETLGKTLIQMKRDLSEARTRLAQNNADTDERFAEMEIQHRLIHGRIEEESNRLKESAARGNNFTVKELEGFRKALATQKNAFSQLKKKQAQITQELKKRQAQATQKLQAQIEGVQAKNVGIEKTTRGQTKSLQSVSTQVSELIDKMLPAVNGLAARVDNLEWALEQLKDDVDIDALQKRLAALAEAIDVQRQSLEMLGNTLTAQVDKQSALLQKTVQGLEALQSTPPPTSE